MEWRRILAAILLAILCTFQVVSAGDEKNETKEKNYYNDEHKLLSDMFKDYENSIRPAKFQNMTVAVKFSVAVVSLVRVDERFNSVSFHSWIRMYWTDERLGWAPANYSNIREIRVPSSKIWRPDIHLYNSAWGYGAIGGTSYSSIVSSDGSVLFIPSIYLNANCDLDLKRFPYDSHTCIMKFGSWSYDGNKIDLQLPGGVLNLDMTDYSGHDEWSITNSNAQRNVKIYPCCKEPYPDITFNLTLTRNGGQYVHTFIVPAVVLSLLIPFVFLLSPTSGEKTYLSLGIILAFTLMSILLEDAFPSAEGSAPYLVRYYASCFVLTAMTLIISQMYSYLWAARLTRPPPAILDTLLIGCIGRLLCVERENYGGLEEPISPSDDTSDTAKITTQKPAAMMDWKLISTSLSRFSFVFFVAVVIVMNVVMLNF